MSRAIDLLAAGIPSQQEGAQLYVSIDGKVLADEAVGEARRGAPMTNDHLLCWHSATKPLVAVAWAQLWEAGRVGLDDLVIDHIPEFAIGGKEKVTIRHLLTHTGGFRSVPGANRLVDLPSTPWEDLVAAVCAAPAEWEAGNFAGYHHYSGWVTLAEIVRRIDGRTIERYLVDEVFGPLGMTAARVGIDHDEQAELGDRIGWIWSTPRDLPGWDRAWNDSEAVAAPMAFGRARGPARELGRFYECMVAGGAPLLRPQTVEAMVRPARVGRPDRTFGGKDVAWGLGFTCHGISPAPVGPLGGPRSFGHPGAASVVPLADPDVGLVVVMATNTSIGWKEHHERMTAVIEAVYDEFVGDRPPVESGPPPRTGSTLG